MGPGGSAGSGTSRSNGLPGTRAFPARRTLALALLAAATLVAFGGVVRNGWILFDDPRYVYANPNVSHGWTLEGVRWFLHEPHGGNWHPLTSWLHMLNVQVFGLLPAGHHAVSLVLHALNAVLLALVLFRLTGGWWRSLLVGALFALHPLRVESVAWASELKDVLSGFLFVLILGAYGRWAKRPGPARWGALIGVFGLGLMAKPMLVTVPFVLVLLDLWPLARAPGATLASTSAPGSGEAPSRARGREIAALIVEKWPLLLLAAASSVLTFVFQRQGGAVTPVEAISLGRRILNALLSYAQYVRLSLWPSGLSVVYPNTRGPEVVPALAAAAGLLVVTALVVWQFRRRPYLAVGWFWYLGMLVPVIGLIQVGGQAYADRYTYLPTIGLGIALAWGLGDLVVDSRARRIAVSAACVVALAGLSAATARRVAEWKDTVTLFTQALSVTRDNPVAHEELAGALLQEGKPQLAIPHLEEALRLMPGYLDAHAKLGDALGMSGRYAEAVAQFQMVLRYIDSAENRHNLGFAFDNMGRTDDAIREYRAALRLDPDDARSLVHLAAALNASGRFVEAKPLLERAFRKPLGDDEARRLLAVTLVRENRIEDAIRAYGEILRQNPDDLDALNNVAWIRATHADARHRDGAEAVRLAERARDCSPAPEAVLYGTLAAAYAEAGRFPDAVRAGEQAIALARKAGDSGQVQSYSEQIASYRAGRPFHFAR